MVEVRWEENYEVVIWSADMRTDRRVNKGDVFEMNEDEARDRVAIGQVSYVGDAPAPPAPPDKSVSSDTSTQPTDPAPSADAPKNEE